MRVLRRADNIFGWTLLYLAFFTMSCWLATKTLPPIYAATPITLCFNDVASDRNTQNAICALRAEGWVVGRGPNNFDPDWAILRSELAVLIVRASEGPDFQPPETSGALPMDVNPNHWEARWIDYALDHRLMDLLPDGKFAPDGFALRADIASLVYELTR